MLLNRFYVDQKMQPEKKFEKDPTRKIYRLMPLLTSVMSGETLPLKHAAGVYILENNLLWRQNI
jgi:hypothetical protein